MTPGATSLEYGKLYNEKDMVRDGYLYGLGLGIVAVLVWLLTHSVALTLMPIVLAVFFLWFFRDPERTIPGGAGPICLARRWSRHRVGVDRDGCGEPAAHQHLSQRVRCPREPLAVAGIVKPVEYREGGFLNAMKAESASSTSRRWSSSTRAATR